ncbi:hypothetical protein [Chitinolyticbacter meiyuanensis]|uniref:hypothetical protein n=1 Tax=Chitinolyticbacter meiyuanensis TaxID=682798 RepID=UPI0011E5ECB0|nr:hypothetical protein [Chitinolyticbacter meiyuanensis]
MADSTSLLPQMNATQANKEGLFNMLVAAMSPAALYGVDSQNSTWPNLAYFGGRLEDGTAIANGTVTLTTSATNYVVAHRTTGAVTASTSNTNWNNTATYRRLYRFTTGSGAFGTWDDLRYFGGSSGGGAAYDMFSSLVNVEVSITGATALNSSAFNKLHVCSGTSADYPVTLPSVSGNAGKMIGLRMAPGLTKLVTVTAASGEFIDGSATRIMWANEVAILYCDGVTWTKVAGKSIAAQIKMTRTSTQSIPNATVTTVDLDATAFADGMDSGAADLTNNRAYIRRPGTYAIQAQVVYAFGVVSGAQCRLDLNGSNYGAYTFPDGTNTMTRPCIYTAIDKFAAGDYLSVSAFVSTGGPANIASNILVLREQISW